MNAYTSALFIICIVVPLISLGALWFFTKRAVEGWEDEEGFHRGKQHES